jgi:hypothetical protein
LKRLPRSACLAASLQGRPLVRFATAPAGAGAFPPARVSQRRWRLWHTELRERPPPRGPLHGAEGPSPGCCSPSGPVPSLTHPPRSWSVRRSSVWARPRCLAAPGGKGPREDFRRRPAGRQPTEDKPVRRQLHAADSPAARGGVGGKRSSHPGTWPAWKDPTLISDLAEQEPWAPYTALPFSRRGPGLGGLQQPGAQLRPPSSAGAHLPPPAIHSPGPPPPALPSTPCRALDSQGQPRRQGREAWWDPLPKTASVCCAQTQHFTDQGQGTCLTSLKPTSPRNLLSPALLPQCVGLPEVVKIQPLILPKRTPTLPRHFQILLSPLLPAPAR